MSTVFMPSITVAICMPSITVPVCMSSITMIVCIFRIAMAVVVHVTMMTDSSYDYYWGIALQMEHCFLAITLNLKLEF